MRNKKDSKEEVWERLKYVPKPRVTFFGDADLNSAYPSAMANIMIGFNKRVLTEEDCVTVRVLKNR